MSVYLHASTKDQVRGLQGGGAVGEDCREGGCVA